MTNEQAIAILKDTRTAWSSSILVMPDELEALNMAVQALQKLDEIARIINCDDPVGGELPFNIQEDVFKYKMICGVMKNE